MSRLELPSQGIQQEPYDRIFAPTLADMQAFVPENTTVPCFCNEDKLTYVWNGSAWVLGGTL